MAFIEHLGIRRFRIVYATKRAYSALERENIMTLFEYFDDDGNYPITCNDVDYFAWVDVLGHVRV